MPAFSDLEQAPIGWSLLPMYGSDVNPSASPPGKAILCATYDPPRARRWKRVMMWSILVHDTAARESLSVDITWLERFRNPQ
ncbi:MAG: hypothetical protein R3C68_14360 [Myxococcota bacterium]